MNETQKSIKDTSNGKGDSPRFDYQVDKEYSKNFNRIFKKKRYERFNKQN